MANETKVIEVRIVGIEEGARNLAALNTQLETQKKLLTELKAAKEKDGVAIAQQTLEIAKTKTAIRELTNEVANEIKIREKRAKQIDAQVAKESEIAAKELAALQKKEQKQNELAEKEKLRMSQLIMKVENEDRRRQAMIEKQSQAETIANQKAEQQAAKKVGYINELKNDVNQLEQSYFRLSKAELNDINVGGKMLTQLAAKRGELQKLQSAYGNNTLGVGQYERANNGLRMSIGMLAGELPNAGISARIFVMSLSNNVQGLAQAIQQARIQYKAQLAEFQAGNAEKPISMFKQLTSAIFSWQTMLMVGVALVVAYWDKIEAVFSKGKQAVKKLSNAQLGLNTVQETLNKTMKDGGGVYATAISEIDKLKVSLEKSKGSTELSKKALKDYNESLGHTFGKAKNVDEALKLIRKNEKGYVLAMQKMAFANAFFSQSAADALKIVEVNTNKNAEILGAGSKKYIDEINKAKKAIADAKDNSTSISEALTVQYAESNDKLLQRLKNAEKAYNDAAKDERERQIKEISNNQKISLTKAREYYNEYADIYSKNGWSFKENEDKKRKKAKKTFDWEQALRTARTKEIKDDEEREISTVNDKYAKLTKEADDAYKKDLSKKKKYDELIILYERDKQREISDIQDKYVKKQLDALEKQNRQIESGIKASIRSLKSSLKEEFNDTDDSVNLMIQNQTNMYSDMLEIAETNIDAQAKVRHAALNLQMAQELSVKELTEQQKLAITEKYRLLNKKVDETALNEKINMVVATAQFVAQALGEESKAGKAAAATAIGIQALQSAWAFGKSAASYFIGNPLLGIPPNPLMGALATLEAAGAIASGYAQIAKIYAVKDPDTKISAASGSSTTKSSVTEKFHTGTYQPSSKSQEQEITRTLLTTERILSPQQTGIFDNILGNIRALGGTNTVMSGVGIGSVNNAELMKIALQQALQEMPQPQVEWVQFKKFEEKMNQFEQNRKNF